MFKEFVINPKYAVEKIDDNKLLITDEFTGTLLTSSIHVSLLSLINEGTNTENKLLEKLYLEMPPQEIFSALSLLEKNSFIITRKEDTVPGTNHEAFWASALNENVIEQTPDKTIDLIICSSRIKSDLPGDFLRGLGFEIDKDKPQLILVITEDYCSPQLAEINAYSQRSGLPLLLLKPTGSKVWLGPLIKPGETACWDCLINRLLLHQPERKLHHSLTPDNEFKRPFIYHPATFNAALNMAGIQIEKYLLGQTSLENKLIEFDFSDLSSLDHHVVKRPQCTTCGEENYSYPSVTIDLNKDSNVVNTSGGYRSVPAEETYQKYKHHISNISGIVPEIKPYGKRDSPLIHNFSSGKNVALQSTSMFWLNHHLRSMNGGKGKNEIQAKTGALCESIERYCLMYHDQVHTVSATFNDLPGAMHPNSCMLFSENQYKAREEANTTNDKFYSLVPVAFNLNQEIEWSAIYSLNDGKQRYLPTAFCYAQYPSENEKDLFSYPDSNGSAAGNTVYEAALQGLLELIERDAVAIWWYNQIQAPSINQDSIPGVYLQDLLSYYNKIDREVIILELTHDLHIPVYASISYSKSSKKQILFGFGAHVDAAIALERSMIEMNQLLPVLEHLGKNKLDPAFEQWLVHTSIEDQSYLKGDSTYNFKQTTGHPISIEGALKYCVNQLSGNGLETYMLDLTQPDIGMPVVRMIVPGLRHFWKRLAPGRLYNVPVKMNWLQKARCESALNPVGMFV